MWMGIQGTQQSITVMTGTPVVDRYGSPTLDFTTPTTREYRGYLQPRTLNETTTDEQQAAVTATVWLPHDAVVNSTDRISAGGYVWRVATVKRLRWMSIAHTEVTVTRDEATP